MGKVVVPGLAGWRLREIENVWLQSLATPLSSWECESPQNRTVEEGPSHLGVLEDFYLSSISVRPHFNGTGAE